jgi:AcrR family transcriptional regulator
VPETDTEGATRRAAPLSRERVLDAAVALADADGLAAVTIRSLANVLGLKPMSLYHYVRGKEDVLDGMVDRVFAEIDLPEEGSPWRAAIRARAISARAVLARHPWALAILDSRSAPGPATLRHHNAVLGVLLGAGMSLPMIGRAYSLVDAYVYGFVLQEAAVPSGGRDGGEDGEQTRTQPSVPDVGRYPHLAVFAAGHVLRPGYSFGDEFEPGLDLILDMIEMLTEPR